MTIDEPSAQLLGEIENSVQDALSSGRPVLHHINADSSWLLQIPRPESATKHGSRVYYNVLLDPWLTGPQSDLASWFSQQFHATPSAIQSIQELEELARDTEVYAAKLRVGAKRKSNAEAELESGQFGASFIDAVAISHEFTDHCHKDTLLEISKDVPVFAVKPAAQLISSWNHFREVISMPDFGKDVDLDWRNTSRPPLPEWVGISRLLSNQDQLDYHSAVMITWNNRRGKSDVEPPTSNGQMAIPGRKRRHVELREDEDGAEALIYTPHGIESGSVNTIPEAAPTIKTLAFLHGQHNIKISSTFGTALQLNLGSHNGLRAQRILDAKYWIGTHDEVKKGGGLVSWFLQRQVISVKDALDEESKHVEENKENVDVDTPMKDNLEIVDSFKDCNFLELRNGESRILL